MKRTQVATMMALLVSTVLPGLSQAEQGAWPRTVTDVNGHSVILAAPAERSAPLPPPLGTFAVAISGGIERVATVHPWSQSVMQAGVLHDYFPGVAELPTGAIGAGFVPNVEELLKADPDLVFQVGFMGDDVLAPIQNLGLPLLTINVTAKDDARDWISMLGQAYGEQQRAREILDWRDRVQAQISDALTGVAADARPRVAHLAAYGEQLRVVGGSHFRSWQIEMAGGINVAAGIDHGSQWISPEQLLVWDPDVILLNAFQSELVPQMLYDDPLLQDLTAVRERRVYAFPVGGDRWEAPVAESPLGWMWLSELLHPEIFDWPLRDEIRRAHQLLYHHAPGEQDYPRMLRVSANQDSVGYDRYLDH